MRKEPITYKQIKKEERKVVSKLRCATKALQHAMIDGTPSEINELTKDANDLKWELDQIRQDLHYLAFADKEFDDGRTQHTEKPIQAIIPQKELAISYKEANHV